MAKHRDATDNHVPYAFTFADETAREAGTGYTLVAGDVGKLARQLDDNSLWMLTDESPISWVHMAVGDDGPGTVTSVAASVPSFLSLSGSPITSAGTLAVSLATQAANTVFSGPTTGANAAPAFRALVADDIPSLNASKITAGTVATARLGSGTADATTFLRGDGSWQVPGGSSAYDPGLVLALCAAYTPTSTGADAAEFPMPYDKDDGTTSVTWTLRRATLRVSTAGGAPSVKLQKSTASTGFSAADLSTVTLGSGDHEASTTAGGPYTAASGDKIRFNVLALGTAEGWTITTEWERTA